MVIAILSVLAAVVSSAVSGTKQSSIESQARSDASSVQTSTDNFNNKSIAVNSFPEVTLGTDATNLYHDIYEVAIGVRAGNLPTSLTLEEEALNLRAFDATTTKVTLILSDFSPADTSDNPRDDLLEPIRIPGSIGITAKRVFIDFLSITETYDADGSVKDVAFVPDFLLQIPSSLPLSPNPPKG